MPGPVSTEHVAWDVVQDDQQDVGCCHLQVPSPAGSETKKRDQRPRGLPPDSAPETKSAHKDVCTKRSSHALPSSTRQVREQIVSPVWRAHSLRDTACCPCYRSRPGIRCGSRDQVCDDSACYCWVGGSSTSQCTSASKDDEVGYRHTSKLSAAT